MSTPEELFGATSPPFCEVAEKLWPLDFSHLEIDSKGRAGVRSNFEPDRAAKPFGKEKWGTELGTGEGSTVPFLCGADSDVWLGYPSQVASQQSLLLFHRAE